MKNEGKKTPKWIIWTLLLIITFIISNLLNKFITMVPFFIKFLLYLTMLYFAYRLLIKFEDYKLKRILIPITPIRLYGTYNQKYLKKIMKFIVNVLIELDYFDISILESPRSKGDYWIILASKINEPTDKPKWRRRIKTNIIPKITLNKGKLYLRFWKYRGDFVFKESTLFYERLKKCSYLKIKGKLIK